MPNAVAAWFSFLFKPICVQLMNSIKGVNESVLFRPIFRTWIVRN